VRTIRRINAWARLKFCLIMVLRNRFAGADEAAQVSALTPDA
jgi:hypothetical protein